ncbi:hypothetical protein ACP4OV_015987 [Aristida adscensionis]
MQRPLRVHTFSSRAHVHAVESSDDGSPAPRRPAVAQDDGADAATNKKKMNQRVTKLLRPWKHGWPRLPQAFGSLSRGAKDDAAGGGDEESDAGTFVSASSSEVRSLRTDDDDDTADDDDDDSELSSFRLTPSLIFPTGSIERPPPASPVKIVRKLPCGYVIGRQQDAPPPTPPPPATLAVRAVRNVMVPKVSALHLRSRSQMVKKVVRALKGTFRRAGWRCRGRGADVESNGGGGGDDVFWKKDVRGRRCRRVEDDDEPY